MGYCFDYRGRLVCDGCGRGGGVRKRKCAYTVAHPGYTIPYCSPPALCGPCYKKHGGLRGIHGDACRDGAAASQAQVDADVVREKSGDLRLRSAAGQWSKDVPKGKVRLSFDGDIAVLVDDGDYEYGKIRWFGDLKIQDVVYDLV